MTALHLRRTAAAVLLVAALSALPLVSAEALLGNLTARGIYVEGTQSVSANTLKVYLGGTIDSFASPLGLEVRGDVVEVRRDFNQRTQVCATGPGTCPVVDNQYLGGDRGRTSYQRARLDVQSWQPSNSELFIAVGDGFASGHGRLVDTLERPTGLATLEKPRDIKMAAHSEYSFGGGSDPYRFQIPAGTFAYGPRGYDQIAYEGDFMLYIYGATFSVTDGDGAAHQFETGYRVKPGTVPVTYDESINLTAVKVTRGSLALQPGANPAEAFFAGSLLEGRGLVHLDGASGLVRIHDGQVRSVANEAVELEGDYRLDVRASQTVGVPMYAVAIDAQYDTLHFSSTEFTVAASPYPPWTWPLLIGGVFAAAGGSGAYVLVRRRRRAETPAAAREEATRVIEAVPKKIQDAPVEEVPAPAAIQTEAPSLSWEALSEEFGLIHAGEKSGVFVLLVPEERLREFLRVAATRGLMAEDTGDRVQAGSHPLAVVALEPSPVAMN